MMNNKNKDQEEYVLVYSSDGSGKNLLDKKINKDNALPPLIPSQHTLKLRRETAGRGGKPVLVIYEIPHHPAYMKDLLKKLKNLCACGGTLKEDQLEIQGDHREKVKAFLEKEGFKVKG
jgi:translation initiation factor 1